MKAALLLRSGGVGVRDVPAPTLVGGDLLVEMRACGLCGSDLEKIRGGYVAAPPVIGHEAVGVVAAVGDGVAGLHRGDRVFPHHHVPCGECGECRAGSPTMCPHYRATNLEPGGFAETFRVPTWNVAHGGVLKLPDSVAFEEGSFIEPLACCLRALSRAHADRARTALVVGAGPAGLLFLSLLRKRGAERVFASEVSDVRRAFAGRLKLDGVWDPSAVDVVSEVRGRTSGRGVDLAIAASGRAEAILQALRSVRSGGTVLLFGLPEAGSRLDFDASEFLTREISLIPSNAATDLETQQALDAIAARNVDVRALVSHRFPLAEFSKAVEAARRAECVKAVVTP